MKKILCAVTAIALSAAVFAGENFKNNVGVGISVPYSSISVDEKGADDVELLNFAVNGSYLGVFGSGFALKGDIFAGVSTSDDLNLWNDDSTAAGTFFAFDIGAGYAFVNNADFTLALTGVFGVDVAAYIFDDKYKGVSYEYNFTAVTVNLGADITAIYRFKENFGLYGDFGFRWIPAGSATFSDVKVAGVKSDSGDTDIDLDGKFIIYPTIGVMWTF